MIGLAYQDQVQVSRMFFTPFPWMSGATDGTSVPSAPEGMPHIHFLLMRNSRRKNIYAHFITADANLSLPPPRHRLLRPIKPVLVPT